MISTARLALLYGRYGITPRRRSTACAATTSRSHRATTDYRSRPGDVEAWRRDRLLHRPARRSRASAGVDIDGGTRLVSDPAMDRVRAAPVRRPGLSAAADDPRDRRQRDRPPAPCHLARTCASSSVPEGPTETTPGRSPSRERKPGIAGGSACQFPRNRACECAATSRSRAGSRISRRTCSSEVDGMPRRWSASMRWRLLSNRCRRTPSRRAYADDHRTPLLRAAPAHRTESARALRRVDARGTEAIRPVPRARILKRCARTRRRDRFAAAALRERPNNECGRSPPSSSGGSVRSDLRRDARRRLSRSRARLHGDTDDRPTTAYALRDALTMRRSDCARSQGAALIPSPNGAALPPTCASGRAAKAWSRSVHETADRPSDETRRKS